jgi:hypothetical protein
MVGFTRAQNDRSPFGIRVLSCVFALAGSMATGLAHAQSYTGQAAATGVMTYLAKGQSAQQQDKDKYACYDWARGQTGFDPTQAAQPPLTAQQYQSSGAKGALVKGAAGGAAIAQLAHGDAGRGAAAGAMGAAMRERAKEQQAVQARQQQAAQQQSVRGQQRANYDRAFGACMEGRGYTVK